MPDPIAQNFKLLADNAPVMIWRSGTDKLCDFFNAPWLTFTGRSLEEELGEGWTEGVHPDDRQRCMEIYVEAFDARRSFTMDYRLRRHDGEYRWVLDTGAPYSGKDGRFAGYFGSCVDITDRKHAEERLQAALAERDVLLAEVHHRVRNNLQVTLSLIGLYRRAYPESADALDALGNRVRALGAVQHQLHETPGLGTVDVRDYLQRLGAALSQLRGPGQAITVRGDTFPVNPKEANALGMIVAEADAEDPQPDAGGRAPGPVAIEIRGGPDRRVTITADGLAEGRKGFAMRLIQAYATKAAFGLEREPGDRPRLAVVFPEPDTASDTPDVFTSP